MSRVQFSDTNSIYIIPNNEEEERSMGSSYYRGLINQCEQAEKNIIKMINDYSAHKIILLPGSSPLTIRDSDKNWYEDDTVILLWQYLCANETFKENFLNVFEEEVNEKLERLEFAEVEFFLGSIPLKFFQNIKNIKFILMF